MRRTGVVVGLALAVGFGVVARFLATSPLWLDEALSVNIASLPVGDIPNALRRDGHPPLYYWMLHGWMELFGDGDVAVRALSGVIGVATLPFAWWAGWLLGGRRVAAFTLALVALSPFAVRYASEARMYSMVMFLVLTGYIALVYVLRGAARWWMLVLAVAAGSLPWTHYWGIYLVAAVGLLLAWRWWRDPGTRERTRWAIVSIVVGLVPFVLWLPVFLDQARHTGTPWAKPARPTTMLVTTLDALGSGAFAEARTYGILVLVLAIVAACSTDGDGRLVLTGGIVDSMRPLVGVIVTTAALGSALGFVAGSAFEPRYAAVLIPLVLLVVAAGLARAGADGLLRLLGASLVVLGVVGVHHTLGYLRTQTGDLATEIAEDAGPDDVVVVCPDQLGPSLARALEQEGLPPPVPYPTGGDPRFVDWRDYEQRNADASPREFADAVLESAGDAPIWLVWNGSYRTFEGQCEALARRFGRDREQTLTVGPRSFAFEPAALYRFE
jgi:mannosyltransferase